MIFRNSFFALWALAALHVSNGFTPATQKSQGRLSALFMADGNSDATIMVNGMPGPMATAAAEACLRKGLKLSPVAMTGPEIEPCTITVSDMVSGKSANVRLIPSTETDELAAAIAGAKEGAGEKNLLAIDYTHPSAVNANALFYIDNQLPFVMGTTGGDRDKLMADVTAAKHFAVIAPNMGKQIVAMQAALEDLASKYPSAFAGYTLQVTESHQKTKADTSGTAKAVIDSLKELSDDGFTYDDINMIRGDEEAMEFGVPEEGLKGHAFHTYTLTSADGSVQFGLQHNVVGRTVYAEGTADAVKFLSKKLKTESEGKVYSMINVLEAGALD
ncbi:tetrahydrodipicolinate reductase 2, chloroplastic [Seminavis robusta]|uniref:4-hydroxy-tetrahydrodipicolinate reductase n=1 Tax=Seminavis robusta TaxID=568900 RepID=A0A9N8HEP8_9STRA|nr:tetrahydrodipicolinate reductase 2, chloroplastic [Seminavis robusta]|eukprot:Sro394_g133940.1 tetrahydrodipicolinate reductase 2, chloroplastic (331) ;mRNA; f:60882-61874